MRRLTLLLLFFVVNSFGAFHADTNWDIRTTGNDANGGGFQLGSTGTDRSQSDAAYQAYTDIVIGGTTTQATSVAHAFDATTPGNIINITGGVGCTVQRVQAVSQADGVVTFDKSLGTAASTCTGNLGGSLLTVGLAVSLSTNFNTIHIKSGTYTFTSTAAFNNSYETTMIGFQTTHKDFGTRPLITTATNSTPLIQVDGNSGVVSIFANINFSNTAAVRALGISKIGGAHSGRFYRCSFDGFSEAIGTTTLWTSYLSLTEVEIKNSTGNGINSRSLVEISDSYIHDNGGAGVYLGSLSVSSKFVVRLSRSIFANNDGGGFVQANGNVYSQILEAKDNVFYGNGADGIQSGAVNGATPSMLIDLSGNIFYGNTLYGIDNPVSPIISGLNRANAYGANGTDPRLNMPEGVGDVTLTEDPFTNAAAGDYSLNSAAGGGALLKGMGYPGVFPGGTTTGHLDIGAVQSVAGPAVTGSTFVQ